LTVISRKNHGFFFNGITDSIIVPEGDFSELGHKTTRGTDDVRVILSENAPSSTRNEGATSGIYNKHLTIEAWVMPDCGGTIIEKEGQYKLSLGHVDTPGPAKFEVFMIGDGGEARYELTTATLDTDRYEGTVYPHIEYQGIQDSYNRFVGSRDDATELNKNHRPLIHVIATVRTNAIQLYINGELVASQSIKDRDLALQISTKQTYIGGKGGEFRGTLEGIHLNASFKTSMVDGNAPLADSDTLLLYRFEEPIAPIEEVFTYSAHASSSGLSTLTMTKVDAQSLASKLTGNAVTTGTVDFTSSPYSSGDYEVLDSSSGSTVVRAVSHVPYNILVNPDGITPSTSKPNQKPPERLRLHSINNLENANPTLTVSSIHLDFVNTSNSNNGLIGALNTSRSAGVDNHFIVVGADLLIESGTSKPYQPPHYSSQIIDRTGQMVLDESVFENHGFVYSSAIATTTSDTNNPFAVAWPTSISEDFQIGHSGRHIKNHVEGHAFLRMLPKAIDEIIDQEADGGPYADIIDVIYNNMHRGIDKQVSVNSLVDVYRDFNEIVIDNVVNTSTVTVAYNSYNGTSSPPAGKRKLIAIGGPNFNYTSFALKGPIPQYNKYDADNDETHHDSNIRDYHVTPSKESRVAILHVPRLAALTPSLSPFVEIHYNAIDLTGASMSGTVQPLLMVEKTVPSSDTLVSGSEYVYDSIIHAIGSGMTLHAPGGYIDVYASELGIDSPIISEHGLVGDTSEGYSADTEIDESLTPANYTPRNNTDSIQNGTPQAIIESVSATGVHESSFNKLYLNKIDKTKSLTDKGSYYRIEPDLVLDSGSAGQFDTGTVSSSSHIHETFDIIDNHILTGTNNGDFRIFIQPSDRRRSLQLSNVNISTTFNSATILYLLSRAKVRSIEESVGEDGGFTTLNCIGVGDSLVSRSIDFTGKGSPDSHIVKEIEPNAPVVTVTLGGPGQGAMDTRPVFQRSMLAHEAYSTRRSYAVTATKLVVPNNDTGTLHIKPLNNESEDLASWGTYGFPRYGRIHLQDGSSAKYTSKTGTTFVFAAAALGSGDFISNNGSEYLSIAKLLNALGYMKGPTSGTVTINGNFTIYNESGFGENSDLENGTTVNDRMHQTMNDVQHDYQLGTQYASTRALAEIPVFAEQFFHDSVGPNNAFKIHVDATHTAHTYNPSPVGRRQKSENELADREAHSAYSTAISNNTHVPSTSVIKWDATNLKLYVNDIGIFPAATTSASTFQDIDTQLRYRKVFLNSGDWAWYRNNPSSDGYLQIGLVNNSLYNMTEKFTEFLQPGVSVFIGGPVVDDSVRAISSDILTPSSDYENRDEYYYDAASVKTQGGNVDYGLRQYVSAVEFKAGPESNPHAARIDSKRATGKVLSATVTKLSAYNDKAITVTLSADDFVKFPNLGYDTLADASSATGDLGYEVQYNDNGTIYKYQYHGHIKTINSVATPKNSITLVLQSSGSTYPLVSYGITINNPLGSNYSNGHTNAMSASVGTPNNIFTVGDSIFIANGTNRGEITAVSSTTITVGGGITGTIGDDTVLYGHGLPDGIDITLTSKRRTILGTSVSAIVSDGSQYYRELKNSLNIDTNIAITAASAASSIEITNQAGKNVNNLHGINVKKDDIIYYYIDGSPDTIRKIGTVTKVTEANSDDEQTITLSATGPVIPSSAKLAVWIGDYEDKDAVLNATWINPYAQGGLRDGDTVWANMSYNNPHAVEGLFAKSRGVLNESQVWNAFDNGAGELDTTNPRDSIPLENFLIGNTCLETARNYVQHVNRTVEENYLALGLTSAQAPVVAYIDPYLSTDEHARVLLYNVAHDKEFIAFQDIHMQVQTSSQATQIGWPKEVVESGDTSRTELHKVNAAYNGSGPSPWTTQIDVTNGFLSQNPYIRSTQQSKYIESAYAHDLANRHTNDLLDSSTIDSLTEVDSEPALPTDGRKIEGARLYGKAHGHHVHTGYSYGGEVSGLSTGYSLTPRTNDSVVLFKIANPLHSFSRIPNNNVSVYVEELSSLRTDTTGCSLRDPSTFFDTPDGTRVIPAFLCLKGIRNTTLDLSSHGESRLQHLPQWKDMDFIRRLTIDLGVVSQKDSVVNTLAGAEEIVRLVNQHAALTARVQTGSAHDPSPFWDTDNGDRGTHMGYIRAHIGREVQDLNGNVGYTIVLHSTVPGASGRNFCAWLDNSNGQTSYQPQFLVGHGGRWRNFWALPDEREGENMHPAPMPLNKHGRPFAPITTLQQYITSSNSGEDVISVADYDDNAVMRAVSDSISGKGHNTINTESLDIKGSSSSLIKGLRTGTNAIGRINFGGLVASGVPGWSPHAGKWGCGEQNSNSYTKRYGTLSTTTYSSYIPTKDISSDVVGNEPIYGFRFKNNIGADSGVRFIYKKIGDAFANNNTSLPNTIDDEVCVFFDDRDVAQGGFTIGKHVQGSGDITGRMEIASTTTIDGSSVNITTTEHNWLGGKWRGVPSPDCTILVDDIVLSGTKLTITHKVPFTTSFGSDKLGYYGFPKENGVIHISGYKETNAPSAVANLGYTASYTYRDGDVFYGVQGITSTQLATMNEFYQISSSANWTCLLTDEIMAAVTAAAINAGEEINTEDGLTFDCTNMYAADGKTLGEWGVSPNAIKIRSYDTKNKIKPLSKSFTATLHQDQGIKAAHLEFGEIEKAVRPSGTADWTFGTSRAVTDTLIDDSSRNVDCGYIPYTLLQINTLAKGSNANTATPVLVDSQNVPVDINNWSEGLRGVQFTRSCGDHILPKIDNPHVIIDVSESASFGLRADLTHRAYHLMIPYYRPSPTPSLVSAPERKRIWISSTKSIVATAKGMLTSSDVTTLEWVADTATENWPTAQGSIDLLTSLYASTDNTREFDGLRSIGSVFSEPIVYFRGGKSSKDHSVPLFFGGGFSGVTLDVNDGTTNDYSSFYTHPYANGPTGVTGLQNANEISTSYAMLDGNAMFAFFPGAALCNQHRGSITPPAFNQQNILAPDLGKGGDPSKGGVTYGTGEIKAKPVPLVLRFAHPTARYEDHADGTDSKTTYLIFGPGQAFPFTQEVADADSGNAANTKEPFPGRVIVSGNTWASIPLDETIADSRHVFPNHIVNEKYNFMPPSKVYYDATAGFHWRAMVNWESPAGYCWKGKFSQRPEHGRHYGQQFNDSTPYDVTGTAQIGYDLTHIHPKIHTPTIGFGITMAADTVWHMDGGFHPGGSWLDNQITFNPPHVGKSAARVLSSNWERANQIHPTAFRTSGVLTGRILDYIGNGSEAVATADAKMEYIVVDATRCQNGEELATVLGAAINAFPGAGALKSLGGTHMPSMGNAMRQDRYGWIPLAGESNYVNDSATGNYVDSPANSSQTTLEQLPASGWIRLHQGTNTRFACYHSREVLADSSDWKVRFYLAPNRIDGLNKIEAPETWEKHIDNDGTAFTDSISSSYTLYVWSKAGTMRFNNENVSARDHMTQVHFSGIVDAVDRTKPIGAVGWHGERYSYLNSLKISTTITKNTSSTTTSGYAAGLGAYHEMLNFSPYGTAGTVMNVHSNIPVVAPMQGSPESTPTIDGIGDALGRHITKTYFYEKYNLITNGGGGWDTSLDTDVNTSNNQGYRFTDTDATGNDNQWVAPTNYTTTLPKELTTPQGLYSSAFLVVSYECESSLIAKFDRDGITANGDWLQIIGQGSNPITYAGTTQWDERFHGQDRFIAPANAGPNVEALIVEGTTVPVGDGGGNWADTTFSGGSGTYFHSATPTDLLLKNATPGLNKTGDLLFDLDHSVGSALLHTDDAERNTSADKYAAAHSSGFPVNYWMGDVNALQMYQDSAAKNFSVENIVWKRMDGGNLSMPAINARGLGAVPWMTRVNSNTAYQTGEKIYGNVRFSFETTNSAMLPILQAQELAHPELMRKHPYKIGNVLNIPNEEIQFQSITVRDETGQVHKIEGGSPLGTIIRGFRVPENRGVKGNAPALANSGKIPNLKVQLPDPNSIPGNIVVRSGFDPIQAYQHETIGSGGMMHPDMSESDIGHLFDNSVAGPRQAPTYENHNWERINPVTFDSELGAWNDNSPLQTSYELHDRTLFFHVTKMGHSHTHRYPTVYTHAGGVETDIVSVTAWDSSTNVLTVDATLDVQVFDAGFGTKEDTRKFLRVYNPTTDEGAVCTYIAQNDATIDVIGDVNFATFMAGQTVTNLKVVPSYYIPAGSNRFFAARRLSDHAEVSGNSPDMANTLYYVSGQTVGYDAYSKPVLTPMPFPRMGHHFVTPTMPMLPGHWAHPAYQNLYRRHLIDYQMTNGFVDSGLISDNATSTNKKAAVGTAIGTGAITENIHAMDAEINFSGINAAPSGPSDVHGGAFTLMFESGVKYDGYGILASSDGTSTTLAATVNKAGGHSIVLEAASEYTQGRHFPDPAEVGAYQIVIQPNVFDNQLIGYHNNSGAALTSQQINTVIGIKMDSNGNVDGAKGGLTLVLAKATQADVRGCEVFINEAILDISNDQGSQFTNIPPLMLYNHVGIQLTESPTFTRKGFPYSKMFSDATPAHTLHIPWWSILHKNAIKHNGSALSEATNYRKLSQYSPEDYYMFMRSTFGSVGSQLTINGYTSLYFDIYDKYNKSISLNPKCTVVSFNTNGTIVVDNANTFPMYPYYQQRIQYTGKNGTIYTKTLTSVSGDTAATINIPKTLTLGAKSGADGFWDNIYDDAILTLTHSYNTLPAGELLTNKRKSVFANILPDIINGNQDTYSNHVPDAFLCMWHPNLGRPNTYFSDNTSRSWKGNAVNKAAYNSLPEHFETIHYHDFTHAMSTGPFDYLIKRPSINKIGALSQFIDRTCDFTNNDATVAMDSTSLLVVGMGVTGAGIPSGTTVASITNSTTFELSATVSNGGLTVTNGALTFTEPTLNGFWPCGSRGGPHASKLDLYGMASTSWNVHNTSTSANFASNSNLEWIDSDDDGSYAVSAGIATGSMDEFRRRPYGYRNAVRQAYNRPRYDINSVRAVYEAGASGSAQNTTNYDAGPLIQTEDYKISNQANDGVNLQWSYGGGAGNNNVDKPTTYVGIMERQSNFTGMLNQDQEGWQVRYSDGRRMSRPFGTPVRTIRNPARTERDWWGDEEGKGETSLSVASQYYLIDWWGNERGEAVRRAPVRGFGIRPSWDCGDAYDNGSNTAHARIWNSGKPLFNLKGIANLTNGNITITDGYTIPRFGGVLNNINNANTNELVDVFAPVHSLRVGDMGNGRGVRYPTAFNEDILTELSTPVHKTGIVLSHNTAEPLFGDGLLRPRNAVLQADEVKRGISAKLGIDDFGLLKSEATVSDRVEEIIGTSVHKDVISRNSPRIGLDAQVVEGIEQNHVVINTEAHSLHTDRNIGQRVILEGAMQIEGSLADADYTSIGFNRQGAGSAVSAVHRYSHTNVFRPYGGSYIIETKSYAGLFNDLGWGVASLTGSNDTSNPYQDVNQYNTDTVRNNEEDNIVKFMIRPVRVLDAKHTEVYRIHNSLHSGSPQYVQNYLHATSGGKYGIFTYETENGRAPTANLTTGRSIPDGNGPYLPIFVFDHTSAFTTPLSYGPKLLGTGVTGFDSTSLKSSVSRVIISENTLQHHRSDAPRRRQEKDTDDELKRSDYSIKPRFSQSLHNKGHKGDVDFNVTDHSGDGA